MKYRGSGTTRKIAEMLKFPRKEKGKRGNRDGRKGKRRERKKERRDSE